MAEKIMDWLTNRHARDYTGNAWPAWVFLYWVVYFFFFSSRRRHTRLVSEWSSDVCSSDLRALGRHLVPQHLDGPADVALQAPRADFLLQPHQPHAAFFAYFVGKRAGQLVRFRALHRRIRKTADAVELGFIEKVEKFPEFVFGLAREAGDEGAADRDVRADSAPGTDASEIVLAASVALHELQNPPARVLERNVDVGEDLPFRHQRDHVVHMRIGINVVEPHPYAQFS